MFLKVIHIFEKIKTLINGAGKTSTFKMITGDEMITSGDVYLNKISIKTNLREVYLIILLFSFSLVIQILLLKYQKNLGYCPQTDPLIDQMTVLENLLMYSRLKGIKTGLIMETCLSLIDLLDLNDHINKMCLSLSGGNKRKLSVAIALVGNNRLNFA